MNYMDQPLGQLALRIPGARRLFDDYHLDYCCAGSRTLRAAADDAGIDAESLAARLLDMQQGEETAQDRDWSAASDEALIHHILTRYHAVHREQFPELIRLAFKVEQVHAGHAACPLGLADLLQNMEQALSSHMRKEEVVLFPMILDGQGAMAGMPITMMRMEHDSHGGELRHLAELTNDFSTPDDACATWRMLCAGLRTFREDLIEHIHIENNILFERYAPGRAH
ncbi:MAG: iron-sulfur cluster repair protein YtfE [Candidimonas sp.]